MFFRIMTTPPGYQSAKSQYMVAKYAGRDVDTYVGYVTNEAGSRFAGSLEEARNMLPPEAKQLEFEAEYQFVELWST